MPGSVLPPITNTPIVMPPTGILTPVGLNLFQQIWQGVFGTGAVIPGMILLGYLDGINFNVLGDKPITLTRPVGAIGWRAAVGLVYGTNGSFSTATAGIYSLAFQQGAVLLGQTALSGITAAGINTPGAVATLTPNQSAIWNYTTIYLNVGTEQGAVSQGNFYLYGYPVF